MVYYPKIENPFPDPLARDQPAFINIRGAIKKQVYAAVKQITLWHVTVLVIVLLGCAFHPSDLGNRIPLSSMGNASRRRIRFR